MNAPYTFLLAGNGQYVNRGCEAIVRGTTRLLREEFGECRFLSSYIAADSPSDEAVEFDQSIEHFPIRLGKRFSRKWLVRQIARRTVPGRRDWSFRYLDTLIDQSHAVLMLGGDNHTFDYGRPDWFFRLDDYVFGRGKPVVLWGASVGPFSTCPDYERRAAECLRRVALICARETATVEYLDSIGVHDNVSLVADPAFLLEPQRPTDLPRELEAALSQGCVGLNLSPLVARFRGCTDAVWLSHASAIVNYITRELAVPVVLVPHRTSCINREGVQDYGFLKRVLAESGCDPCEIVLLGPGYNAGQTKWIIGQMRAFVGARTHSTIAALSSFVPTLSIAYSQKAKGLVQDIYGDHEWLIETPDLTAELLSSQMAKMLSLRSQITEHLKERVPTMISRARSAGSLVRELIERPPV